MRAITSAFSLRADLPSSRSSSGRDHTSAGLIIRANNRATADRSGARFPPRRRRRRTRRHGAVPFAAKRLSGSVQAGHECNRPVGALETRLSPDAGRKRRRAESGACIGAGAGRGFGETQPTPAWSANGLCALAAQALHSRAYHSPNAGWQPAPAATRIDARRAPQAGSHRLCSEPL